MVMKIALLGTGLMGRAMVERLLGLGHTLAVYNRTRAHAAPLEKQGARIADTPGQAVESSEAVILMLKHAEAIGDVLFPGDRQRPELEGRTVIQMGTILPDESIALQEQIKGLGGEYLEAPVLGSISEVHKGTLCVMVGAGEAQFRKWVPLLRAFSQEPLLIGPVGQASALKLALNQLIASQTAAFSYSFGIIQKRGVDIALFMRILRESALYASQFDKKLPLMRTRDFSNPNFSTKNLLKDVDLILEEGRSLGLETAAFEGVRKVVRKALDMGFTETDYSSLYNAVVPEDPDKKPGQNSA